MRAEGLQGERAGIVADYITAKTHGAADFQEGMYTAFAVMSDQDAFCAGVIVSDYREHDCVISCASETPTAWRPNVCRTVFRYIFGQLGCVRVTAFTTKKNRRSRAFLEALGFRLEGSLRRGYNGKHDALIYGLLVEDCRFFDAGGLTVGQESTESTARA